MANKMIHSAISAVLALSLASTCIVTLADSTETKASSEHMMGDIQNMEKCYGVAKAGRNDCGTATHSCSGETKKDGEKDEWIVVPTGVCNKIVGGNLKTPTQE